MQDMAIRKILNGDVEAIVTKVTEAIKPLGFGVLTRIDFDKKLKEKLDKNIPQTVVLGACNPQVAYTAYRQNTDVSLLIPCNIVVRGHGTNQVAVEALRPSAMLNFLPDLKETQFVIDIEKQLEKAILDL